LAEKTKEASMRFYTQQQVHYCGIDLHARSLYVCILDQEVKTLVHRKLPRARAEGRGHPIRGKSPGKP